MHICDIIQLHSLHTCGELTLLSTTKCLLVFKQTTLRNTNFNVMGMKLWLGTIKNTIHFLHLPMFLNQLASSFLSYWSGLHKQADQQALEAGAQALKDAALHFHQEHQAAGEDTGTVLLQ